jgi:translation elongation factor EF-Ts
VQAGADGGRRRPRKAEEILRVKLGSKASKAASRITAEGVVAIHRSSDDKLGAMIEINCETDFVGKNDDFLKLARDCAALVTEHDPMDVAALSALPMGEGSVESTRTALVGKIGENMSIRRFVRITARASSLPMSMAAPRSASSSITLAVTTSWARIWPCILPLPNRKRWIHRVLPLI